MRVFVLPDHAGCIDEGVLIAKVVSSKTSPLWRMRQRELNGYFEVADVRDGHLQAVFGELEGIDGHVDGRADLGGLFGGGLG